MIRLIDFMKRKGISDLEEIATNDVLDLAIEYLGGQYIEIRKDTYRNLETGAQVRLTNYDLNGHRGKVEPHINFETEK